MRKITSLLTLLLLMVSGVNVWGQLPEGLELTTDKNNPVYYHIKSVRTSNGRYWHYRGDDSKPNRVETTDAAGKEGYWFFMAGSNQETVKIFNSKGTALTTNLVFTAEGNDWYILNNKYRQGAFTISKVKDVASDNSCIDAQTEGIGWWKSIKGDNEGTAWTFEKVKTPQEKIQELTAKVNNESLINQNVTDSYVGFMSDENKAALNQAISDASGKTTEEDYTTFKNKVEEILAPKFEEGAFYIIENQNTDIQKRYPSTQNMHCTKDGNYNTDNDNDRVIRRVNAESPLLPRLWKFEKKEDGKYWIRNANTNCLWCSYGGSGNVDMPINSQSGGHYSVTFVPCNARNNVTAFNTKFYLTINGKMINASQGDNSDVLSGWNDAGDHANFWSFKKVTEIPVTIGATGWASICLPFAVTLPEGVNAYIAESAQGDVITLKEVSGVIPANTGMLLTATSGSYNLNISKETATANVEGNLFKGANTKRLGFADGETFGMGANGNTAVFKKNNLKNGENGYVPANKAYILTSDLGAAAQGASLLSIEFGGATTGIEGVQAEDNKEVIYFDLNGRRVINPAHGVFVTNTGKKVFIR